MKYFTCLIFILSAEVSLAKIKKSETASKSAVELVSYDEWFTLTKIGTQAGKKYKFIACFDGGKNMTSVPEIETFTSRKLCSSEKMVFYSSDLIKNREMHRKMVSVEAEILCVTAMVTGGKGKEHIYSISDEQDCQ